MWESKEGTYYWRLYDMEGEEIGQLGVGPYGAPIYREVSHVASQRSAGAGVQAVSRAHQRHLAKKSDNVGVPQRRR